MEPRVYFLGFGTGRRGGWTWVAAVTAVWEASQEGGTRLKRYSGLAGKDVEARHAWRRDTNASRQRARERIPPVGIIYELSRGLH